MREVPNEPNLSGRRPGEGTTAEELLDGYRSVRRFTEALAEPLQPEDCVIQSMPDVSPTAWHLAHTSWFFETFVLQSEAAGYRSSHPEFAYLFNSYYNHVGKQFPRAQRGLISRPGVKDVLQYRRHVDSHMEQLLEEGRDRQPSALLPIITLGLNHEQQHQELMLTDIKHVFSCNPLRPAYAADPQSVSSQSVSSLSVSSLSAGSLSAGSQSGPLEWIEYEEGIRWIGHDGNDFAYDNESPRHRQWVPAIQLASRLVSCREFLAFIDDGGYQRPELWLSDGWKAAQEHGWCAPLYWKSIDDGPWQVFTLHGMRPLPLDESVVHVSYYEADAYARWANACLPREAAWEFAAQALPIVGNFVERQRYHPDSPPAPDSHDQLLQMYGDVWEWTQSAYSAYPGYEPSAGALGEYNGKFMCNQFVLRGGSCATSSTHIRTTYRNFFPPDARWQFTGIRLARE